MAIRIPIISDFQGDGIKQAKAAFGNFKTAVANAEGGMGKFKAGAKVVTDAVSANAGLLAVAGGIAFAKFAASGITAFQDLALAAGKFADATGLSVQDASRYMEAAKDIGIPIDAVETAIGKLNKTIGADPDKVRNLGIDLVYLKDGSLDVNETFLNTIDRLKKIKDPAEKARVAAQLLGKGWQSMSELINMGADDLKKNLDSVSEAQVIDPEELRKAKEFRDTMDDFGDKVKALSINFGEFLVPIVSDIVDLIDQTVTGLGNMFNYLQKQWDKTYFATMWDDLNSSADEAIGMIKEGFSDVWSMFSDKKDVIPVFAEDLKLAQEDAKMFAEMIRNKTNPQLDKFAEKLVNAKTATDNAKAAWSNLIGQFERQVSFDKLDTDLDTLKEKAIAAFGGGKAEMDAFHEMQLTVAQDFQKFAENFPPALSTEITVAINSGDIAQLEKAVALIDLINGNNVLIGKASAAAAASGHGLYIPHRASGGPVMGGQSYLVGEKGPELFTPGTSGGITPNGGFGGGGNTINVTVTSADPNAVVAALQKWVRNNGALAVTTNTAVRF